MSKCTNCNAELAKDFHEKCQPCNRAYLSGRNEALTKAKTLLGKAAEIEQERIIELLEANHYENTWEHYPTKWVYMENCMACDAIALIKGEK